ncbi:tyrosine-type recombinase/integrase [Maribacter sp. CXY002]|uniref:tyrosine-type recombinase/integrase n=1 Tax=Maribacter luteocoastalis TaxID=3407671 RepID=UPI003B6845D6
MNFNFYLSSYIKKNGTQLIRLKLETSQKDVQYLDTGISIKRNQWDIKKKKIKKHVLEEQLNGSLVSMLNEVQKIYYGNAGVSAKRLLKLIKNRQKYASMSFVDFYQNYIDEKKLEGKIRTAISQQKSLNKFKAFVGNINFSELTIELVRDYEKDMLIKGNKTNTISLNIDNLKKVMNIAEKQGLIINNPIKSYKTKREHSEKQFLSVQEIDKLSQHNLMAGRKGMNVARDIFLFSFYAAGMRFSDVCKLKWSNISENHIVYVMSKSKERAGSKRTVPLNNSSLEILKKYEGRNATFIFPPLYGWENKTKEEIETRIMSKNQMLNVSLKLLDKRLGFGKGLSFHMAKHSFADFAVKNNTSLLMASKLLGHTKLSTTQHYLKDFYQKEQVDEMNRLFG